MNLLDNRGVILDGEVAKAFIICHDIPARGNSANAGHKAEGFVVVRPITVVSYRRLQIPKGLTIWAGLETLHC